MARSPRTLAALLLLAAVARAGKTVELTDATFESVREEVLPSKEEERWREIPWRTSAWDAVVEATESDKPVLLWAMNGHPLACT
jgi:hypothetical protein